MLVLLSHKPGDDHSITSTRNDSFTIDLPAGDRHRVDEHVLQERAIEAALCDPDLARKGYTRRYVTVMYFIVNYR